MGGEEPAGAARTRRGRARARARTSSIRSSSISRMRFAAACSGLQCATTATSRTVEVRIPAGVTEARACAWPVKADAARAAAPSGDLYLRVQLRPHPVFERKGARRLHKARVPVATAVLGGEVDVVTPEAKKLRLSAGGHAERPAIPAARSRPAGGRQAGRAWRSLRERGSGHSRRSCPRKSASTTKRSGSGSKKAED